MTLFPFFFLPCSLPPSLPFFLLLFLLCFFASFRPLFWLFSLFFNVSGDLFPLLFGFSSANFLLSFIYFLFLLFFALSSPRRWLFYFIFFIIYCFRLFGRILQRSFRIFRSWRFFFEGIWWKFGDLWRSCWDSQRSFKILLRIFGDLSGLLAVLLRLLRILLGILDVSGGFNWNFGDSWRSCWNSQRSLKAILRILVDFCGLLGVWWGFFKFTGGFTAILGDSFGISATLEDPDEILNDPRRLFWGFLWMFSGFFKFTGDFTAMFEVSRQILRDPEGLAVIFPGFFRILLRILWQLKVFLGRLSDILTSIRRWLWKLKRMGKKQEMDFTLRRFP